MIIRRIAPLKSSNIAWLHSLASEAIISWASAWSPKSTLLIHCAATESLAFTNEPAQWHVCKSNEGVDAYFYSPQQFIRKFESALFDCEAEGIESERHRQSAIGGDISRLALEQLILGVIERLNIKLDNPMQPCSEPENWLFQPHFGTAMLTLSLGGSLSRLFIPADMFSRNKTPKHSSSKVLQPLTKALSNTPVSLSVQLGEVEMTIENWLSISAGDVIQFSTSIESPLKLLTCEKKAVCEVNLGRSEGHRAIQIVGA